MSRQTMLFIYIFAFQIISYCEPKQMQAWLTTAKDQSHRLSKMPSLNPLSDHHTGTFIKIDTNARQQTIEGFGAALTSSSAYVIKNSHQYGTIMEDLFGSGLGISYIRLPMGACDFQAEHPYTYDDSWNDFNMDHFSIDNDTHFILPVLKKALEINPNLKIIGSPWSAPAWMKKSNKLFGGEYRSGSNYDAAYAKYFLKFVQMYQQEGIHIDAITVQNEPNYSTNDYPTMKMTPQQQRDFIRYHLGPTFRQNGITTKIVIYDHNWDGADFPAQVLSDQQAAQYVSGVAWHCYGGDYWVPGDFHRAHPQQDVYFTECSGDRRRSNFADNLVWNMRILFLGQTKFFAKTVLLWNLALDEHDGPKVGVGGCPSCRGVLTVPSTGVYTPEVEYYSIGHMTQVVKQGAVHLKTPSFDWNGLHAQSFINPDGSLGIVVLNPSSNAQSFTIHANCMNYTYNNLPGTSVVSLLL